MKPSNGDGARLDPPVTQVQPDECFYLFVNADGIPRDAANVVPQSALACPAGVERQACLLPQRVCRSSCRAMAGAKRKNIKNGRYL